MRGGKSVDGRVDGGGSEVKREGGAESWELGREHRK